MQTYARESVTQSGEGVLPRVHDYDYDYDCDCGCDCDCDYDYTYCRGLTYGRSPR